MKATVYVIVLCAFFAAAYGIKCTDGTDDCYDNADAVHLLADAGISVHSSGGCSDKNISTCTSLEQIHKKAITDVITLKTVCKCSFVITGGTETGHMSGTYSHWNGWKLDVSMSSELTNYIKDHFAQHSTNVWCAASGNRYYYESNHWDINYGSGCV